MALFADEVALTLGGEKVVIFENYDIKSGIFLQPAGFAVRLGHGGVAEELIRAYPPKTPFSLSVNGKLTHTGVTDGFASGEGTGATEPTFAGRDVMARLTDAYVAADTHFQGITYAELTEQVLKLAGLSEFTLVSDNEANRKKISAKLSVQTKPPQVDQVTFSISGGDQGASISAGDTEVILFQNEVPGTTRTVYKSIPVTIGTKWYEGFLKIQLERAGLFLWATCDGNFLLSVPNGSQTPTYELSRIHRNERGEGNVIRHGWSVNVTNRYSKWIVYGRGGGRNFGRAKVKGSFVDPEMSALYGGDDSKVNVHHDNSCDTVQKCAHLARRRCAEANREGWALSYTVAGHSKMSKSGLRANWAPDTVVAVDDRELGIAGNFYLESLQMNRGPETTTTIRLMRIEDLVFATEAA